MKKVTILPHLTVSAKWSDRIRIHNTGQTSTLTSKLVITESLLFFHESEKRLAFRSHAKVALKQCCLSLNIFFADPDPRIRNPETLIRIDPGGQNYGSGSESHLDIFVAIEENIFPKTGKKIIK